MPQLDDYFQEGPGSQYDHPLVRYLDDARSRPDFRDAKLEVSRPAAPLGHQPTRLYLHVYSKGGGEMDRPHAEEWDDELNTALVDRQVPAVDVDNETVRFALGLRAALQGAESKFGDGYFNAVLVHHIANSPFRENPSVTEVLKYVHRSGIEPSLRTYAECRGMIDGALRGRARQLVKDLGYGVQDAREILSAALAQYLDERFSVSNRRTLGFL